jgi:hypothetical protein
MRLTLMGTAVSAGSKPHLGFCSSDLQVVLYCMLLGSFTAMAAEVERRRQLQKPAQVTQSDEPLRLTLPEPVTGN